MKTTVTQMIRYFVDNAKLPLIALASSILALGVLPLLEEFDFIVNLNIIETLYYITIVTLVISSIWISFKLIDITLERLQFVHNSKSNTLLVLSTLKTGIKIIISLIIINLSLPLIAWHQFYYEICQKSFFVLLISAITWFVLRGISIAEKILIQKYNLADSRYDLYTRVHIIAQIASYFVLIMGIAAALMVFDEARRAGVTIIASAGFISIIAGIAGQNTLGAVIGGLQLALTQPIKIGDVVVVEGEFGSVEEITLTYVVIKLWDLRRLIVSVKYFLEHSFQNWTRNSSELLGPVMLYLDYSVPVEVLREKLKEVLDQDPNWDRKLGVLHVTEFKENTLEIRILVSAINADKLWNLRCSVREKLYNFLRENYPTSLPGIRLKNT